jgi:hypothetical protein
MSLTPDQQIRQDRLEQAVLAKLDELLPDGNVNNAPTGGIIDELNLAARALARMAPTAMLAFASKSGANATVQAGPNDAGVLVVCPSDFMRFLRLRLSNWKIALNEVGMANKGKYQQQSMAQLRGSSIRPYAALVPYSGSGATASKLAIECYPKAPVGATTIAEFTYIPKVAAAELPEDFDEAIIWYAVSNVFVQMRLIPLSQIAERKWRTALGVNADLGYDDREFKQDLAGRPQ